MLTRYYRQNKEKLSKKACGRYQNLSEEEKTKSANKVANDIKNF